MRGPAGRGSVSVGRAEVTRKTWVISIAGALRIAVAVALAISGFRPIRGASLPEAAAKAAFLYNATKFIKWPAEDEDATRFTVCIAEGSSMDRAFRTTFEGKQIGGKPVDLRFVASPDSVVGCRVLFIAGSDAAQIRAYLKSAGVATLTAGDSLVLLENHGMLGILVVDVRLALYINSESIRSSHLELSPQLLRLAKERPTR